MDVHQEAVTADLAALSAMLRRQRERALAEDEEDLRTERNPHMREVLQRSIEELRADLFRMDEERTAANR